MENIFRLFLVIILVSGLSSCKKFNEHKVSGTINNSNGPVANASVEIVNGDKRYSATTDDKGEYVIKDVPEGDYTISGKLHYPSGSYSMRSSNISVKKNLEVETMLLPLPVQLNNQTPFLTLAKQHNPLTWSASTASDFREYKLYRHSTSGIDETTGTLVHVSTSLNDTIFTDSVEIGERYFYRLYTMNDLGLLGGSNVKEITPVQFQNDPTLTLGSWQIGYATIGTTLWFSFPTVAGKFYTVRWKENIVDPAYSSQSLYVGAYQSNQSTSYFYPDRLIHECGSPRSFLATETGTAYLKVYADYKSGSFALNVEEENSSSAQTLSNGINYATLSAGQVKLFKFSALKDTTYTTILHSFVADGTFDNVCVNGSAFSPALSMKYYYEAPFYGSIYYNTKTVKPTANTEVYLVVTGGYWKNPTDISIDFSH